VAPIAGGPAERICAITAASGYVGSVLASHFADRGWRVHRLTRTRSGPMWSAFDLREGVRPEYFRERNVGTLIHCAWDLRAARWSEIRRINVDGSIRLLNAARSGGVHRGVFLSSMSAFAGCRSLYGKAKMIVEQEALRLGYAVVRPGLIYGRRPGGIVGGLTRLMERSAFLPVVAADAAMYTTYDEDLCGLVHSLVSGPVHHDQPIAAASPQRLRFGDIVRTLGARAGKNVTLVPLPWQAAWVMLRLAEWCGLNAPFRSDSVISLVNQNPDPHFGATGDVGVVFRDLSVTGAVAWPPAGARPSRSCRTSGPPVG
jgi:nucleoside-diphosphate-sugar epimerase